MAKVLITGCAGFIGFHLCRRLLDTAQDEQIVGIDNLSSYYDVDLKKARLARLTHDPRFRFLQMDLADRESVASLFKTEGFENVVNLAAQAGIRYSLARPEAYIDSNVAGFANILEGCRHSRIKHLVFASSSSIYGANTRMPFSVHDNVDHPLSLYAATKKANELMAHAYSHLYGFPCTGLRFFTVYGPWGRPDMAYFLFTQAILESRPIQVFDCGHARRDFTYIDDVIEGVVRIIHTVAEPDPNWNGDKPDPATSNAPYRLYNIGNQSPVELLTFIKILESKLGRKAILELLPPQPGDVPDTYADVDDLYHAISFKPQTSIEEGIQRFVAWYREYYRV
jgi:UDP-glucuronate 4-epimerase